MAEDCAAAVHPAVIRLLSRGCLTPNLNVLGSIPNVYDLPVGVLEPDDLTPTCLCIAMFCAVCLRYEHSPLMCCVTGTCFLSITRL